MKVKLTYDEMGRIVTLADGSHRLVSVKYEERFGKPSELQQQNLGNIKITYNGKGEVATVESPQGTLVAQSITESYNNLLEIMSPATQDLY